MKSGARTITRSLIALPLFTVLSVTPIAAEPIVPAADGTGTLITPDGNRFDITGGTTSADGTNLFHSFTQFGLEANQIANFISHPAIMNILGRVTGGDASVIEGLLQVSGGNSNLFLMNPAGIIFGTNAQLNVPADFTATTATGIGIGDDSWFQAVGSNNYASLIGTPNTFNFGTTGTPGAILNTGNLAVGEGQNLSLLGGTVISTGHLAAANGNITVAAVPGQNLVRLSQPGHLLSLDIQPNNLITADRNSAGGNSGEIVPTPASLAELLTGGNTGHATSVVVDGNSHVALTGSGFGIENGDVVAKGVTAGNALLWANHDLTLIESQLQTTGDLNLLAQNIVRVRDSVANPFLAQTGGNLYIQGNQGIDILALNHLSQTPFTSGGNLSLVSDRIISGDAHFSSGGSFSILNLAGQGGNFVSLYDPIVTAIGDVRFGDYTGASLKVEATGSITAGNITITQADTALTGLDPDIAILTGSPSLILRAGLDFDELQNQTNVPPDFATPGGTFTSVGEASGGRITVGNITTAGGPIILEAPLSINLTGEAIASNGGNITFDGQVILYSDETTINSAGGNIAFNSTVDAAHTYEYVDQDLTWAEALVAAQERTFQGQQGYLVTITSEAENAKVFTLGIPDGLGGWIGASDEAEEGTWRWVTGPEEGNVFWEDGTKLDYTNWGNGQPGNDGPPVGDLGGEDYAEYVQIDTQTWNDLASTLRQQGYVVEYNVGTAILNLDAGAGNINFNDAVGSQTTLGGLTITSANNVTATSSITADSLTQLAGTGTTTLQNVQTTAASGINLATNMLQLAGTITSNAGLVNLTATNNITNSNITSAGGSVNLTANNQITAGNITSAGGLVNLTATNNITTSNITSVGGGISLTSGGAIDTTAGTLDSSSTNGDGGAIAFDANGDITAGTLNSSSNAGNGGVSAFDADGNITTGNLDSYSNTGNGGAIAFDANGKILVGSIDSHSDAKAGGAITLSSTTGAISTQQLRSSGTAGGGSITVTAGESILTGVIDSSSSGNGGSVTLGSQEDIEVASINAQGGTGSRGGDVDITASQFVRALGIFLDQNQVNASISTAGQLEGGSITIRHDGGQRETPFDVGDATTNGTAGAITSAQITTISPVQSFPESYTLGNIKIITSDSPPEPEPPDPQPPDPINFLPPEINPLPLEPINNIPPLEIDQGVDDREESFSSEYEQYFGQGTETPIKTLAQARSILSEVEATTDIRAAFIYVSFVPASVASQSVADNKGDELELLLVTANGRAIRKRIAGSTRSQVIRVVRDFQSRVTSSTSTNYLNSAKQVYQWIVTPLEADLQAAGIQNLVFIMDKNLRSIPLAALHSGQEFLVEKYSISLMPSLTLTDSQHRDIRGYQVLAMGASQFTEQKPLPAVPLELSVITQQLWQGKSFLNEDFTLENLKLQREQQPFRIVHLATHGEFQPGAPANSYLQLWDTKLRLSQLPQLNWSNPPVDLLVLSACRTALGNEQAELGFAGLALQAGVKSALASLWYVSDEGTLGLMSEFYKQLRTAPIKAEALRQTQIAMLRGQVRLENGQLVNTSQSIPLPEALSNLGDKRLMHPYYWAAFTLIGNPW